MGKGSHKVFSTVVKEILQEITALGESGSEVSHFIPEPRNFAEVTKLSENIKKAWIKATLDEIKISSTITYFITCSPYIKLWMGLNSVTNVF